MKTPASDLAGVCLGRGRLSQSEGASPRLGSGQGDVAAQGVGAGAGVQVGAEGMPFINEPGEGGRDRRVGLMMPDRIHGCLPSAGSAGIIIHWLVPQVYPRSGRMDRNKSKVA